MADQTKFNPCDGDLRTTNQMRSVILIDVLRRLETGELTQEQAEEEMKTRLKTRSNRRKEYEMEDQTEYGVTRTEPTSEYCLGFVFSGKNGLPVLHHKDHGPEGSLGWNGWGGHIELGESAAEAMAREFLEEVGADIPASQWRPVVTLLGEGYRIHCFAVSLDPALVPVHNRNFITWPNVHSYIERDMVAHEVSWLLPLAWAVTRGVSLQISEADGVVATLTDDRR